MILKFGPYQKEKGFDLGKITCDGIEMTEETDMTFGKYKGMTLGWILATNLKYLKWCHENVAWFKIEHPEKLDEVLDLIAAEDNRIWVEQQHKNREERATNMRLYGTPHGRYNGVGIEDAEFMMPDPAQDW